MVPFLGVHVARHTHASMLLDAGATMVEVQTRLRHTKLVRRSIVTVTWQKKRKKRLLKN